MAIQTYSDLISAIGAWIKDADITARAGDCISLAEADFRRQIVAVEQDSTTTLGGVNPFSLPDDFDSGRAIVSTGSPPQALVPITINQYAELPVSGGEPQQYAVDGMNLYVWPAPTLSTTLNLSYRAALQSLSDTNTTNWLLTSHPDAYLFGSLLQAEFFGWNDERLPMIQAKTQSVIDDINRAANRKRYGGLLQMQSPVQENAGRAWYAFRG